MVTTVRAKDKTTVIGGKGNPKVTKCRLCLVETGPHNVRHRTKLQYYICSTCDDMEDKERRKRLKIHVLNHYGENVYVVGRQQWNF